MAQTTMYPPVANSPVMYLAGALTASSTEATVADASAYSGVELPFPLTLGTGEGAETVLCTAISGNALTLRRALEGTAASWPAGTAVSRNFCALDHRALADNIRDLDSAKAAKAHASQHGANGSDPISPSDIGAASYEAYSQTVLTVQEHISDADVHVTTSDKTAWNSKASGTHASQHEAGGADEIKKLNLDKYTERVGVLTGTTIDFDLAPVLTVTLSGDTTFASISGTVPTGYAKSGVMLLTTGDTAPTVTFPSNVVWVEDMEIKANSTHEIVFRKYPGLEKWIASCSATVTAGNSLLG